MSDLKVCNKCQATILKAIELEVDIFNELEMNRWFVARAWVAKGIFKFGALVLGTKIQTRRTFRVVKGGQNERK